MDRRVMITWMGRLVALPLVGTLGALVSPMFRFLRPKVKPYHLRAGVDTLGSKPLVVGTLSEFAQDWAVKEFMYMQENVEYTPRGKQANVIPGFVVKVPAGGRLDTATAQEQEQEHYVCALPDKSGYLVAVQRICPHLGCIFNFEKDPKQVQQGYGGFLPQGPVLACPCHLSIYDLTQPQQLEEKKALGKVVSGPAPRPPRRFTFKIEGENVIITGMEGGGIA
jgi:Rieske Fe-S protein